MKLATGVGVVKSRRQESLTADAGGPRLLAWTNQGGIVSNRIFRVVEVEVWQSPDFRQLSAPPANAQTLWLYLLTGTRTSIIPGAIVARRAVLADDLRWDMEAFDEAFDEVLGKGLAKHDEDTGLTVLKNALIDTNGPRKSNKPQSPNVLKAWGRALARMPRCALKDELSQTLKALAEALGEGFAEGFAEGLGEDFPYTGNREQGTGNRNNRGDANETKTPFDFAIPYAQYPRKQGKAKGLEKLHRFVTTQEDYDRLVACIKFMARAWKNHDTKFCPYFSTFANQKLWRDEEWPTPDGARKPRPVSSEARKRFG